jgi:hypothetical protein
MLNSLDHMSDKERAALNGVVQSARKYVCQTSKYIVNIQEGHGV